MNNSTEEVIKTGQNLILSVEELQSALHYLAESEAFKSGDEKVQSAVKLILFAMRRNQHEFHYILESYVKSNRHTVPTPENPFYGGTTGSGGTCKD